MTILIVDDNRPDAKRMQSWFPDQAVYLAHCYSDAIKTFDEQRPSVIILDMMFPRSQGSNVKLMYDSFLQNICSKFTERVDVPRVILVTQETNIDEKEFSTVQSWRDRGVVFTIESKSQSMILESNLRYIVPRLVRASAKRPSPDITEQALQEGGIVWKSQAMYRVGEKIALFAKSGEPVLIVGETGVGKEHVARALHNLSRRTGPFQAINSAAIAQTLSQSELFGHEKGAFNSAELHIGKIENSHRGTCFFDEIQSMPLELQPQLLRVLDHHSFTRVGGNQRIDCDVRFVFATNANLEQLKEAGAFRQDLLARIRKLEIVVPPLRERRDDVPVLARNFLRRISKGVKQFSDEALKYLEECDDPWTDNARSLGKVVETVYANSDRIISVEDVRLARGATKPTSHGTPATGGPASGVDLSDLDNALRAMRTCKVASKRPHVTRNWRTISEDQVRRWCDEVAPRYPNGSIVVAAFRNHLNQNLKKNDKGEAVAANVLETHYHKVLLALLLYENHTLGQTELLHLCNDRNSKTPDDVMSGSWASGMFRALKDLQFPFINVHDSGRNTVSLDFSMAGSASGTTSGGASITDDPGSGI